MRAEQFKTMGEGVARTLLHHVPPETEAWLLKRGIERILISTHYEYAPHFWETIGEYAASGGFVIVQNHTSNADILAGNLLANRVTQKVNRTVPEGQRMQGFIEPFALSLKNGTQGEMSQTYSKVEPLIKMLRVQTNPTPTLNDILHDRIKTYQDYVDYHRESTRKMRDAAILERRGIILPPEATVQGGRINPDTGDIYGMQVFTPGAIRQALKTVTAKNDFGILIPVAISGGYKVLNSETNGVTLPALLVGLGPSKQSLMTVRVGEPIVYRKSHIRGLDAERQDYKVGTIIARMLDPHERGVYGDPEVFDLALAEYKDKQVRAQEILRNLRPAA